jgi:hypothetical protein
VNDAQNSGGIVESRTRGELIVGYGSVSNTKKSKLKKLTSNLRCDERPRCRGKGLTEDQTAFLTSPERRQRVHTRMRKAEPFTSAFTRCRLGLKTRLVLLFAWLTLFPV